MYYETPAYEVKQLKKMARKGQCGTNAFRLGTGWAKILNGPNLHPNRTARMGRYEPTPLSAFDF